MAAPVAPVAAAALFNLIPRVFRGRDGERPGNQGTVVRKVDNAIHRINRYPVDSVVCFVKHLSAG